jgi:hypothetical protein
LIQKNFLKQILKIVYQEFNHNNHHFLTSKI